MIFGANSHFFLAASEYWLTRWLTPFWILGVGILIGLLALLVLYGVIAGLAAVPLFDVLRRKGISLWIGLGLAGLLTALAAVPMQSFYLMDGTGEVHRQDWLMSLPAVFAFFAVTILTILYCSNKRFLTEFWETTSSGIGSYILTSLGVIVVLAGLSTLVVEEPADMVAAIPSVVSAGQLPAQTRTLPGVDEQQDRSETVKLELSYDPTTLQRVVIRSDRNIILNAKFPESTSVESPIRITANTPFEWRRGNPGLPPIPAELGMELHAQNLEYDDANVQFVIETQAVQPEMFASWVAATLVFIVGALWFLQLGASPRLAAIVLATSKSEISQPLPKILILFAALSIAAFVFIPFHTMGEDIKLLKDCGITLIMVVCLFQGIWSASSTVNEEIEGRTALTLLSKPIRRRSFIFGKLLGILWVIMFMVVVLGALELVAVAYKPLYDARENSLEQPLWQQGYVEMFRTIPGIIMVFFQASVLTSISVALATRLPQLANFAVCFSLYLIGHLTPSIVNSSQDAFPIVQFVGQLIAVVTPNLDMFSINGAIDANNPIPAVYLSGLFVYSLLFCGLAMLIGLLLFEDRDLA